MDTLAAVHTQGRCSDTGVAVVYHYSFIIAINGTSQSTSMFLELPA